IKIFAEKNIVEADLEIINCGKKAVTLEMVQSFSLGMLSPFRQDNAAGKYFIHRMQSHWSAECRPERLSVEAAGLEMSWQAAGMRSLRFGQRSTMPVKDFYPFAAVEDQESGVIWGAQLAAPGAWQMEVSRFCDMLNISGGITDREFGNWTRKLMPGEHFRTMPGILSCVRGDIQQLCSRLSAWQDDFHAPADSDAPPFFNEYCSTWGSPTGERVSNIVNAVKGMPLKYFILDDGWFYGKKAPGSGYIGDWNLYEPNYPEGFDNFLDSIRNAGFIPGIWFEFEVAVKDSILAKVHPEYLLTLDDFPVSAGDRRFLDFRKAEVREYLTSKVIDFLEKHRIGYIKVDYNACVSCGCDGGESPAENQHQHIENVLSFFAEIRRRLPELVIEVCSSGGHRISPEWVKLADVVSASDAHEGVEIPIIAANVQKMICFGKSQIWAVVRADDSIKRLCYSLAGAMIGRMCISGDADNLNADQLALTSKAVELYKKVSPVVKNGVSKVEQHITEIWNEPSGYQLFERHNEEMLYMVLHTFAGAPEVISWKLPEEFLNSELIDSIYSDKLQYKQTADGTFVFEKPEDFEGAVFVFKRKTV
ncbi:MAG: alpha-galactosidase, partial [Lentisphaeria bacterium]|nr:alpha-galactosidase [Lentisphaeria bacterium]